MYHLSNSYIRKYKSSGKLFLVFLLVTCSFGFRNKSKPSFQDIINEIENSIIKKDWESVDSLRNIVNRKSELVKWPKKDVNELRAFKSKISMNTASVSEFYKCYDKCNNLDDSLSYYCYHSELKMRIQAVSKSLLFSKNFVDKLNGDIKAVIKFIHVKDSINRIIAQEKLKKEREKKKNKIESWKNVGINESQIKLWEAQNINFEEASQWVYLEQKLYEIKLWKKDNITKPEMAKKWLNVGVGAGEVNSWRDFDFETIKEWRKLFRYGNEASYWINKGAKPDDIKDWIKEYYYWCGSKYKANYTYEDIIKLNESKVKPEFASYLKENNYDITKIIGEWQKIIKIRDKILSFNELLNANPYSLNGKYFEFCGNAIQFLNKNSALMENSEIFYVKDLNENIPKSFIGVVKCVGVYNYIDTVGAKRIVPKLVIIQKVKL